MGSEANIGDDAVREATGRGWDDWLAILDAFGGREKGHAAMARHLHEDRDVPHWWAQTITVRYELERGLREVGQRGDTWEVSVSRTIRATPEQAWDAIATADGWNSWFTTDARVDARPGGRYSDGDGDEGEILAADPPRRLRMTWGNPQHCPGTEVEFQVRPKTDDKIEVRVMHRKLARKQDREHMRGGWRWAMDSLRSWLETGRPIPSEKWEPS